MTRKGLLLVNLGTPDAPRTAEVRRYLREFLSDPRVLDVNPVARWLLLSLVILPFRSSRSAAAYRAIWTDRGSPLLVHSRDLASRVAEALGTNWRVELAMRYGEPSIPRALDRLREEGVCDLVVFPLYPQYAASTTGSTLEAVFRAAGQSWNVPLLAVAPPFYDDPAFVRAFAEVGRPVLEAARPDHVLFSFHGLPERQIRKSDESGGHCLTSAVCCDAIGPANRNCYRAQCFATARALREALGLAEGDTTISFQSRLGRTPWIGPHTDAVLPELVRAGRRRLAVFCPSFVADCLETLEEIGIRAREQFRAAGGEELVLVPSLNAHPLWVEAVVELARRVAAW